MKTKNQNIFLPSKSLAQLMKGFYHSAKQEQISSERGDHFFLKNTKNNAYCGYKSKNYSQHAKKQEIITNQRQENNYKTFLGSKMPKLKSINFGPDKMQRKALITLRNSTRRKIKTETTNQTCFMNPREYSHYVTLKNQLKIHFDNKQSFYRFQTLNEKSNHHKILKMNEDQPSAKEIQKQIYKVNFFCTTKDLYRPTPQLPSQNIKQIIRKKPAISDIIKPIPKQALTQRKALQREITRKKKMNKFIINKKTQIETDKKCRESVRGWTKYPINQIKGQEQQIEDSNNQQINTISFND